MRILEGLEPANVFRFFEEMSAIPHGSTHTGAISDYCVRFAADRGLVCHRDEAHNIIIKKPGSAGYETSAPVILQGHLDMVCEKTPTCRKNLEKEGLDLFVDGDLIGARGTTLGGDDLIAVSMALAILDSADLPHPPLEAVFTTDEEIGMLGAAALDASHLQGRTMLNIDSEEEGVLTISCAGGNRTICTLPLRREPFSGTPLTVAVSGLIGGHSGEEINKGRGNSSLLMGRVLYAMSQKTELRLTSVNGGQKDNAIPRETIAQISAADPKAVQNAAAEMDAVLKREYQGTDPDVSVRVEAGNPEESPMDVRSTAAALCLLTCVPNGVQAMSRDIPGLVQTSLNLGILTTDERTLRASFCVRSSLASQKQMLVDRLTCLTAALDGNVEIFGDYPAWEFKKDSVLRQRMVEVYREQYGREPRLEAIHAGVECGLFCGKLPGLDCVSYGPDLTEIHTPRERMSISSVQRVWKFTLEVLRRCR
jgi:dipeptidase D